MVTDTPPPALAFHGGRLGEAARRFPDAPLPWLDLSTGINPVPWRPSAPPDVDLHALPDEDALARLETAAAAAFDAPGIPIAAVPGSEIGLRALAGLNPPKPWRIVAPCYRSHAAALPGAAVVAIADIGRAARDGGTILLANPNNPDGRVVAPDLLLDVAAMLATRGGLLVVDEAFADAVPAASVLPRLAGRGGVLVFRSFGKFFGLAGVRLGFACGDAACVAAIAERVGSWPVSATAIAFGERAYADTGWIERTREALAERAVVLDRLLTAHRLEATGDCPSFRLLATLHAPALFDRLGRAGILVRPFDYAPDWLRIGVPGNAADLARLDAALRGD